MPSDLRDKPLVACLHPYVEERRKEIEQGLYPRNRLRWEFWHRILPDTF